LGHGGAQRTLTSLTAEWVKTGHRVRILVFTGEGFKAIHQAHPAIEIVPLGSHTGSHFKAHKLIPILARLRHTVTARKPDVVLSFQDIANFTTIMATLGTGCSMIVAERRDPGTYRLFRIRQFARSVLYRTASAIVVQTLEIAAQLPGALRDRTIIIPNACPKVTHFAKPADSNNGRFHAITIGRMVETKGFSLLLRAASIALTKSLDWHLDIYGYGPESNKLKQQVKSLNLESVVTLHGTTSNVMEKLEASHLFLFPSIAEGFPNALAEAIAVGLPAIANDGVSGVTDLLVHQQNGLLINQKQRTPEKFAEAMLTLMNNSAERTRMGKNSLEIARRFSSDSVLSAWEEVLQNSTK